MSNPNIIIPKEKLKNECVARMNLLDIDPDTIERFYKSNWITTSTEAVHDLVFGDQDQLKRIDIIENMYNGMVYYTIESKEGSDDIEYIFFVGSDEDKWDMEKSKIMDNHPSVYKYNITDPSKSSIVDLFIRHDYENEFNGLKTIRPIKQDEIDWDTVGPNTSSWRPIEYNAYCGNREGIPMYGFLTIYTGVYGDDIPLSEKTIDSDDYHANMFLTQDLVLRANDLANYFVDNGVNDIHVLLLDPNAYRFVPALLMFLAYEVYTMKDTAFSAMHFILHMDHDHFVTDEISEMVIKLINDQIIRTDTSPSFLLFNEEGTFDEYRMFKDNGCCSVMVEH